MTSRSLPLASLMLILLACAALAAADGAAPTAPSKGPDVVTVGPPAVLSAEQRARIEAKRALNLAPALRPAPAGTEKRPSVVTAPPASNGASPAAPSRKPLPGIPSLGPAPAAAPAPSDEVLLDEAAIEAVRAALGLDLSRAAGLVKSPESRPARRPGAGEHRTASESERPR